MKLPPFLFLLASIGAACLAIFTTSCATTDEPGAHTQKVRSESHHSDMIHRHRRRPRP